MRLGFAIIFSLLVSVAAESATSDSVSLAAQYYYSHHDYQQALGLWSEVLKRDPENATALLHVCELKLISEGRDACRELMLSSLGSSDTRSAESKKFLIDRFRTLQTLFLSDEGQTSYLQAVSWIRLKEYPRALASLERSNQLEKGNALVLREKANTERTLGMWDAYIQSCQSAYENDPFDPKVIEETMEVRIYLGNYSKVIAIPTRSAANSVRAQTALAISLLESGNIAGAQPLLQSLAGQGKNTSLHPIIWYALGKVFSTKRDGRPEAATYLQRFISAAARPENLLIEGWDPYRSIEKIDAAKELLASLNG